MLAATDRLCSRLLLLPLSLMAFPWTGLAQSPDKATTYALPQAAAPPLYSRAHELHPFHEDTPHLTQAPSLKGRSKSRVVYLAPFVDESGNTNAAKAFRSMLRLPLAEGSAGQSPLNFVAHYHINALHTGEDGRDLGRENSQSASEQEALAMGADVLIRGQLRRSPERLQVRLTFTDLISSQTEVWEAGDRPVGDFAALLRDAVTAAVKHCGAPDHLARSRVVKSGLPSADTWKYLSEHPNPSDGELKALQEKDPGCLMLWVRRAELNSPTALLAADEALQKWPDSKHLLLAKVYALYSAGRENAGAQFMSEVVRRYPTELMVIQALPFATGKNLPNVPRELAPEMCAASVETIRQLTELYPDNWGLRWDLARARNSYAFHARGETTIDKVAESDLSLHEKQVELALKDVRAAIARQPTCPKLLEAELHLLNDNGLADLGSQKKAIERIHKLDPSNVEAEIGVAYSHSIGWTEDVRFFPLIRESLERHSGDLRAIYKIAEALAMDLRRLHGFKVASEKEIYGPNPETFLFKVCTKASHRYQLDSAGVSMEMQTAEQRIERHWQSLPAEEQDKLEDAIRKAVQKYTSKPGETDQQP